MGEKPFRFKQFSINQDRCAMKVGTDGILLGAWAKAPDPKHILDLGTGTGLLALMIAQRFPSASIDAIELDAEACLQAADNFRNSPWNERLHLIQDDFRTFAETEAKRYELIICNPPFFTDDLLPPDPSRQLARHDEILPKAELLAGAKKRLSSKGILAMILPANLTEAFLIQASLAGFSLREKVNVRPLANKKPHRTLISLGLEPALLLESELIIQHQGANNYTEAFRALTGAFYL